MLLFFLLFSNSFVLDHLEYYTNLTDYRTLGNRPDASYYHQNMVLTNDRSRSHQHVGKNIVFPSYLFDGINQTVHFNNFGDLEYIDAFPKIIWIYWAQGWDNAPDLQKSVLLSWKYRNEIHGWKVIPLSDTHNSLQKYLPDFEQNFKGLQHLAIQARSDILRTALIYKYGGLWVDATVFCVQPLHLYLPHLLSYTGSFFFTRHTNFFQMAASWYIAATPNHPTLTFLYKANQYFLSSLTNHQYFYFFFHKNFNLLYDQQPLFKHIWNRTPQILCTGAHGADPEQFTPVLKCSANAVTKHRCSKQIYRLKMEMNEQQQLQPHSLINEETQDPCSMVYFPYVGNVCKRRERRSFHLFDNSSADAQQHISEEKLRLMRVCRPDYMILGCRKCATTSLHTLLSQHPQVIPFRINGKPQDGELPNAAYNSLRVYNQFFFDTIKKYNIDNDIDYIPFQPFFIGESSVASFRSHAPHFLKICKNERTDLRLIILLRDPIERCVSQMRMRSRLGTDKMNKDSDISKFITMHLKQFNDVLRQLKMDPHKLIEVDDPPVINELNYNCIYESIYSLHLARWLHRFPPNVFRIYFTDDFKQHSAMVLEDVMKFIGLDIPDHESGRNEEWYEKEIEASRSRNTNSDPIVHRHSDNQKITFQLYKDLVKLFSFWNRHLLEILSRYSDIDRLPWFYTNDHDRLPDYVR